MKFTASDFPAKGNELTGQEIVRLCQLAEEVGFDRFGVTDFPFHHDCVALMGSCLQATRRIEVESLVTTPYARLPDVTACAWATMAEMSDGRVILGIGGGVEAPSMVWVPPWGNERPHPVTATRELIEICRDMWAGRCPVVEGMVLRSSGMGLDFALSETIPVLVAARGPRMLALAGEIADIVHIASPFLAPGFQRETIERIRDGASKTGRSLADVEIDLTVALSVGGSPDKARRLARLTAGAAILWMAGADEYAKQRHSWQVPDEFAVSAEVVEALANDWNMWSGELMTRSVESLITDEVLDQFAIAGGPEDCIPRLRALADSLPEVTGFRFKFPPMVGRSSYDDYASAISASGEIIDAFAARDGIGLGQPLDRTR